MGVTLLPLQQRGGLGMPYLMTSNLRTVTLELMGAGRALEKSLMLGKIVVTE